MKERIITGADPAHSDNDSSAYRFNGIGFWLNGRYQNAEIAPALTTLEFLQKHYRLYGTKCSCNEGDCGACTVVIASVEAGHIVYKAINSCLYPAAKLHGKHLITVEGIGTPEDLHPIQKVMLDFHATQCGYCTPGFVMSLFALLVSETNPSTERILAALEGNLCRCTGYDSILKAAEYLSQHSNNLLPDAFSALHPLLLHFGETMETVPKKDSSIHPSRYYACPNSLDELWDAMEEVSDDAYKLICGGTDIMVQVNIQKLHFPYLIDISAIGELQELKQKDAKLYLGAGLTYSRILASQEVRKDLPALAYIIRRIASEQIRNFGTLAGNIGNASPIGDTLPLLLALGTELELSSRAGIRTIPLADFFLDYRSIDLKRGEIISSVIIPLPPDSAFVRTVKASKRKSVDISALCTAIYIDTKSEKICKAALGLGGVAKTPVLSKVLPQMLIGKTLKELKPQEIAEKVADEFRPIDDVRGSRSYRRRLIKNHILMYLQQLSEKAGVSL